MPPIPQFIADLVALSDKPDRLSHADQSLINASQRGDLAEMERALSRGANPNALDELANHTPMSISVAGYRMKGIELLLRAGADINAAPPGASAPLLYAATRNDYPMARLLLEAGADPMAVDPFCGTALLSAVWNQNAELTALLLPVSDPLYRIPRDRRTLLHVACEKSFEMGALALAPLCDARALDASERTALMIAAENDLREVVKALLPLSDINAFDSHGRTAKNLAGPDALEAFELHEQLQAEIAALRGATATAGLTDATGSSAPARRPSI